MPIPVSIPRLGWNMEEGVFVEWLKADGEVVKSGDAVFRLEGEKATEDSEILDAGVNRVKLGIVGPRSVQVIRKEVQLTAENNLTAGLLSAELKDLIVKKIARIPQAPSNTSDKTTESGYSGHPNE